MRHKEFWIALGVGAAIGGVAALLYAPQTGTATRKKLKRGLEDLGDTLEDAGEYLKDQAERLGKEAQKLIDASKDQFDDAVDAATGAVKSANKAARSASKLISINSPADLADRNRRLAAIRCGPSVLRPPTTMRPDRRPERILLLHAFRN